MFEKLMARLHQDQKGVTRLTIAVILIACAAVAGLLAYTSLSPQETPLPVFSGLEENGTLQLRGAVLARGIPDDCATEIIFTVALAGDAEPVNFTMSEDSNANGLLSDETMPVHTVIMSYIDRGQRLDDLTWSFAEYGPGDGDSILEPGENFRITVGADNNGHTGLLGNALNPNLGVETTFTVEVRTPNGKVLAIERTTPDRLDAVVNLH